MTIQKDIELVVNDFKKKLNSDDRYTSFDYCYNYFRSTKDLTFDIEKSCLVLGFYLASWGMLRGSSVLLQHSASHFKSVIEYINSLDESVWDIDVDTYDEKNIEIIKHIYKEIKIRLIPNGNTHLTLITKVLLGVFGFIPAFDNYFCKTFRTLFDGNCGFRRINKDSLGYIHNFYLENKSSIDLLSNNTYTTDFVTGKKTEFKYPKAKIIDMYGFNKRDFIFTQKVFEAIGEGGSICINRQKGKTEEKFMYHQGESYFIDSSLDINKSGEYPTFDRPFQLINKRYPWYMLHVETVHPDYIEYVVNKLIQKLNENSILSSDFDYQKNQLEKILKIKLICNFSNGNPVWTYTIHNKEGK